jgi:hypothetical protein
VSAADHPSRYRRPIKINRRMRPLEAALLAHDEAPDLIAAVEFLLGMTGQYQQNEINRAPYREP